MFKYYLLYIYNKIIKLLLSNTYINKYLINYTKTKKLLKRTSYKSNKKFINWYINNRGIQKYRTQIINSFRFLFLNRIYRICVRLILNCNFIINSIHTMLYTIGCVGVIWVFIYVTDNDVFIYIYIYILLTLILFIIFYSFYNYFYNIINYIQVYMLLYYTLFIIVTYIQFESLTSYYNIIIYLDFKQFINNEYLYFFSFTINNVNMLFISTTIQISFFTNIYVFFYMNKDQSFNRFFILLNMFSFSMIFLLHSNTIIMLFFFWECIGGVSFFLINYFFYKSIVFKSSFKAFIYNRISDVFLLTAIVIYYSNTGSIIIDKHSINLFINNVNDIYILNNKTNTIDLFVFFLTIAAFVKSAQFPLHFWLPDSMEAPVPASALIHSATLVAAGIFLFFKFSIIIYNSKYTYIIIILNSITLLLSSITACVQTDVKKLLAYSTISNCSIMFISFFLSNNMNTLLYFIIHGWSKSLSFFIVGIFVILYKHNQDSRLMSSNTYLYIIMLNVIIVSIFTLSFWFFLTNGFVKHSVVGSVYISILIKTIIVFSVIFSYAYSIKLVLLLFSNYSNNYKYTYHNVNQYIIYSIYMYLLILIILPYAYCTDIITINNINLFNIISYILLFILITITLFTQHKYNKNIYIICIIFIIFLI